MTDSQQPLIEHLLELRSVILKSLTAVLVLFICLIAFANQIYDALAQPLTCLLYTSPSPRDQRGSRMPSSA